MKPIEYYMDLNYGIEIRNIPKEDGGGVKACIPQLGRFAAVGHGDDIPAALSDLEDSKKELLEYHIEKGIPIPEPDDELENLKSYSGRFLLRITSELHRQLAEAAKANRSTLNQYCATLLASNYSLERIMNHMNHIELQPNLWADLAIRDATSERTRNADDDGSNDFRRAA